MFNSYSANPTANIEINTVSGTLTKTLKESHFERFHMKSPRAEHLFDSCASEVVLQVMLCGEGELLAEVISWNKYQEVFEGEKNERKNH